MTFKTYADVFWGGDLRSTAGYDALTKRNHDSKKMFQELEEYLKKRSKVESDYSKNLQNLVKCFKQRDEIGVIEATFNKFKNELETIALCHQSVATFYHQQSEAIKKFKDEQVLRRKSLEDSLYKAQNNKSTQLTKTLQLEKNYVRKFCEKDAADLLLKEMNTNGALAKEVEKAKNKATRAEEEAERADSAYRGAVKVLEDSTTAWEKEMISTCESIQNLDVERLVFLRKELWMTVNAASKTALDIDYSCEAVRGILEKCDVFSDIQAFIEVAKTGEIHPEQFVFRHYSKLISAGDNDSNSSDTVFHVYHTLEELEGQSQAQDEVTTSVTNFNMKNVIGLPRLIKKKS